MIGPVHRRRLAVLGLGRLGRACANAILEADDLVLSGIIRRAETLRQPLPAAIADIPVVAHPGELSGLDAVLICLPAERVLEAAKDLLQHHTPIVEAAILAPDRREIHWQEIDRKALRRDVPAVVGAGWDPGLRASFESLLTISCPRGSTRIHDRPGVSLHHTLAARAIPGVKDALCAEFRAADGVTRRYVYVEASPDAEFGPVAEGICNDPLFLNEETIVLPVESLASLEAEGHGLVMERWGRASGRDHQRFLVEGRFDRVAIAGQVMVAAARALPRLPAGAHRLTDIPLAVLQPKQ